MLTLEQLKTRLTEIETRINQVTNQVTTCNQELFILHGGRAETVNWITELEKPVTLTPVKKAKLKGKRRGTTEVKPNGYAKTQEPNQVSGSV